MHVVWVKNFTNFLLLQIVHGHFNVQLVYNNWHTCDRIHQHILTSSNAFSALFLNHDACYPSYPHKPFYIAFLNTKSYILTHNKALYIIFFLTWQSFILRCKGIYIIVSITTSNNIINSISGAVGSGSAVVFVTWTGRTRNNCMSARIRSPATLPRTLKL